MAEQFRVTSVGQPRGVWRDTYDEAMQDAVDLGLASRDAAQRKWYLAVPVSIKRRGTAEPPPPEYPTRRPRHREAWNDEDISNLRRIAKDGDVVMASAIMGRSREAISRKARQLGVTFKATPSR